MDPRKASAEWFRTTVFKDEPIQPKADRNQERIPSIIRAARSLEKGARQVWQSRETIFMKQAKLLANYEDDYDYSIGVACYYPTYQNLTDQQLRGYFAWRTKLRKGDICETSLSFAFLYIYELINQIGVTDSINGFQKLVHFREVYGKIDKKVLSYLDRWLVDYMVYYGLDWTLLPSSLQAAREDSILVLEHIREESPNKIMDAVKHLSRSYLERSRFYKAYPEDMDRVIVQVLRRVSDHYTARCKKTMVERYFGSLSKDYVRLFDAAVFCDPLKRLNYEYSVNERLVYFCKNGAWTVWAHSRPYGSKNEFGALIKTIDSMMRQAYGDCRPVKAEVDTKWTVKIIYEEIQALLAEKQAAEAKKIIIDYTQLNRIRQDAAVTQEKLIVEDDMDALDEPVSQEPPCSSIDAEGDIPEASPLSPTEYRLLHCLLYGGDLSWIQTEGFLLSVLVDGINEKLYDIFADTVLDDTPQLVEDYIDDLKEMVCL